jgi:hypothetical protein
MSERDDRFAGNNLPNSTAEFRATPDASASTAEFRAFVAGQSSQSSEYRQVVDSGPAPGSAAASWPEQPWPGEAPSRGQAKTIGLLVGIVIAVAVIVAVVLLVL